MPTDEKAKWNAKYAAGLNASLEPEEFFVSAFHEFLADQPPGAALDVAGGVGRHALWLAQRGWRVKLVDIAEGAITKAREAAARTLAPFASSSTEPLLDAEVMDLNAQPGLGDEQYDLVMVFFYLQRRLFPALARALKPGGLLIYQTYTVEAQRLGGGPANPEYLLRPGELPQAFQAMQILHYQEQGLKRAAAELVARKPGA